MLILLAYCFISKSSISTHCDIPLGKLQFEKEIELIIFVTDCWIRGLSSFRSLETKIKLAIFIAKLIIEIFAKLFFKTY